MKSTWLNDNIKPLLALAIVFLGFTYFFTCLFMGIKPDPQILIAVVGAVGVATGYYFGSSSGSAKKDDAIANVITPPAQS